MKLMDLLPASLRAQWIAPAEVRAEAWALGVRHQGRVIEGARAELAGDALSMRRTVLLKAVIRNLTEEARVRHPDGRPS
jgi:hypothetical protein